MDDVDAAWAAEVGAAFWPRSCWKAGDEAIALGSCDDGTCYLVVSKLGITMSKANFFIAMLAVGLLCQGCVGVAVKGTKERTFEPVMVSEKPSVFGASGDQIPYGKRRLDPAPAWLKEHWGEPSKVKGVSGPGQGELWTYYFDRAWCGVMPVIIIIPIPLMLPVDRERVVFHIREGVVEKADVVRSGGYEAIAGFGPDGPFVRNGPFPPNF